jgi:putative ubiquitin-RnfH superfamily antitoxin RatB of RatAB toxin-antitoxin module
MPSFAVPIPFTAVPMARIRIEVAYAMPARQHIVELAMEQGATAADALRQSGILDLYPELDGNSPLGIHGRVLPPDTLLREGDRVEVYRPLTVDPKAARIDRAAQARQR